MISLIMKLTENTFIKKYALIFSTWLEHHRSSHLSWFQCKSTHSAIVQSHSSIRSFLKHLESWTLSFSSTYHRPTHCTSNVPSWWESRFFIFSHHCRSSIGATQKNTTVITLSKIWQSYIFLNFPDLWVLVLTTWQVAGLN